jgi:MFS family permease
MLRVCFQQVLNENFHVGQPSFIAYMGLGTRSDTAGLIGTATGLFYAGGVVGCFLSAWMADWFGRKMTVATGCVITLVATACLAGSVNIGMFIAFRFFCGLG